MKQNGPMDRTPGENQEPEWLEAAPSPLSPAQRELRRRILGAVGLVMVGVLITSILVQRHEQEVSKPPAPTTPTAGSTPTPTPRTRSDPTAPASGSTPVVLRRSTKVLDDPVDFDLFALSGSSVYRIEAVSGKVTRTTIELRSDAAQSSFLALPGAVIVRPGDSVPGVLVRDGRAAQPLQGLLRDASFVLPGPDGLVWTGSYDNERRVMLSDLRGRAVGPVSPSPAGWAVSDHAGNLLVTDVGGTYESRPSGLRRVTTGQVSAVGPHHYLLVECDEVHACSSLVLDRTTGARRRLATVDPDSSATGTVSPDGRYAVLSRWTSDGDTTLRLQDLRTGRTRGLRASSRLSFDGTDGVAVWSPDSRHLFLAVDGHLGVVDPATASLTQPDLGLFGVVSVALRPGE